ncbi:MAG: site-2 protease family protein [Candidatus Krumholzibacteria bacterium]|nr:site-2 protease family protein [Candidatus Krumholzibacteria bacterium]
MTYLVVAFLVGVLIALHEVGHLLAAKLSRIPIARLSVGFGPRLFSFKRGRTEYWISAIPLGGYVLPGLDKDEFRQLSASKQIAFALGGPIANLAAAFAGLFALGLVQFQLAVTEALRFAATNLWADLEQMAHAVATLFTRADEISGIVGIVAVGGAQHGSTLAGLLTFSVLINLNLVILNLLPLPPLDGGRILFCTLEKLYRPLHRARTPVTVFGLALLLGVMVYATVQDVGRIVAA